MRLSQYQSAQFPFPSHTTRLTILIPQFKIKHKQFLKLLLHTFVWAGSAADQTTLFICWNSCCNSCTLIVMSILWLSLFCAFLVHVCYCLLLSKSLLWKSSWSQWGFYQLNKGVVFWFVDIFQFFQAVYHWGAKSTTVDSTRPPRLDTPIKNQKVADDTRLLSCHMLQKYFTLLGFLHRKPVNAMWQRSPPTHTHRHSQLRHSLLTCLPSFSWIDRWTCGNEVMAHVRAHT